MTVRKIILLAFVLALAAPLAACGRKGPPEAPPGADEKYPRSYPASTVPVPAQ